MYIVVKKLAEKLASKTNKRVTKWAYSIKNSVQIVPNSFPQLFEVNSQ